MNSTKLAILITLLGIMKKGGKHYASPSPDTIRDLLKKYHQTNIGRRWLFQCLRDLETAGLITRRQRYKKITPRRWKQKPSLIAFTMSGATLLFRKSVAGAAALRKSIKSWIDSKRHDKRWPKRKDLLFRDRRPPGPATAIKDILPGLVPLRGSPDV